MAADSSARASTETRRALQPLACVSLAAIIFYEVSGGPFGVEGAVAAGGPLYAVLGFVLMPLIWSVPEALISAELATMFPENSGFVAWTTAAFGPFWGFQEGLWSWLSGVSDNAVYPVLFLSYLGNIAPCFESGVWRWVFLVATVGGLAYLNYRGLAVVGRVSVILLALTLAPFAVFIAAGLPHIRPRNWLRRPADFRGVQWGALLQNVFWNLNYWHNCSNLAGEVQNPRVSFPRGLALAVVLVVGAYLLPLLVGLGVDAERDHWVDGYLQTLARRVGGEWLGYWVLVSAAMSNVGLFEAEMSSDSFQLQGMAERGMLPARLAHKSVHGTPGVAIMFSCCGVLLQASKSFAEMLELVNVLYCLCMLLEFASFLKLRAQNPDKERPYRVPLGKWGCALMLLPATLFICILICLSSWWCLVAVGVIICAGPVLYWLINLGRRQGWWEFYPLAYTMPPSYSAIRWLGEFDVEDVSGMSYRELPSSPDDQ
eukprot:gene2478-3218_t